MRNLKKFVIVMLIVGIFSLYFMLSIPGDPKTEILLGFSVARLMMLGVVFIPSLFLAWMLFHLAIASSTGQKIEQIVDVFWENETALFVAFMVAAFLIAISGLFVGSWFVFGEKYYSIYERLAPVILFEAVFGLQLIFELRGANASKIKIGYFRLRQKSAGGLQKAVAAWTLFSKRFEFVSVFMTKYKLQRWLTIFLLILLSSVYFRLTTLHAQTQNLGLENGDQGAFLEFTQNVYESNFHFMGDRNQMPLYAYLQALFFDPQSGNAFLRAKYVNIYLSVVLLILTFGVLLKYRGRKNATFFVLVIAFSLFIFRAGYSQAELLFYFLIFISFLLMGLMLTRPSKKLGILTGIVAGLAQLTKASMLPGLGVFVFFYGINLCVYLFKALRNPVERSTLLRQVRTQVLSLLLVLICFIGMIYPYIHQSKQIYGQYLYNVNSTFYIWYDSWDEALQGTIAHGDRLGWPDMSPDEIPSFSKYLREHTPAQIMARFQRGATKVISNLIVPYGQFNYLLILLIGLLVTGILWWKISWALIRENAIIILFVIAFLGAYLTLYAWYRPISGGYRFTYSLYMIAFFAFSLALERLCNAIGAFHVFDLPIDVFRLFEIALLILLLIDLVFFIPVQLDIGYFGG